MNFLKNAIVENKQVFFGIIGGTIMFGLPTLFAEYVRPILHHLY
jgi:uncharacterized membrane protein SpoIIM required for sporulation